MPDISGQRKVIIWGASGHALVAADIFRLTGSYAIAGFLDNLNPERRGEPFCGAQILGGAEQLERLRAEGVQHVFLGFGNCEARLRTAELAAERGFSLATAIHPRAVIAEGVSVGVGTLIAAGAVVNPGARVGANVIINTCASVDHESIVEDGAHICPGARLAGMVTVGRAAWVGIGASVIDHIRIGAGAIIGAGAVVVHDIPDGVLAYGVPARVIKRK